MRLNPHPSARSAAPATSCRRTLLVLGVFSLVVQPAKLTAQSGGVPTVADTGRQHVLTCARAVTDAPAGTLSRPQAALAARACGRDGGAALARGLREVRQVQQPDVVVRGYRAAYLFQDATVFATLLETASAADAAPVSRAWALIVALSAVSPYPRYLDAGDVLANGALCMPSYVRHSPTARGTPLPSDARRQVEQLATRLRDDSSTPAPVRSAAACTARMLVLDTARVDLRRSP